MVSRCGQRLQIALGQVPNRFGITSMLRIRHQQVRRQAMAEGAHFAGRAARRRLARQAERPVTRLGDLAREQVDVVKQMIHPRAAIVLIYAHGPQRQHLQIRIGIHTCQLLDIRRRHTGDFLGVFERIGLQALSVFLERDGADRINLFADIRFVITILRRVADVFRALLELQVVAHEINVIQAVLHQVVHNGIGNRQIAVVVEYHDLIGFGGSARGKRGQIVETHTGIGGLARHQAAEQHRVRLGHIRTPGHEHIGLIQIGITAGGLVGLEDVHERHHGAGHAQTRIAFDIVRQQSRLPELRSAIAFHDRLLPATPERNTAFIGQPLLAQLARHQIERLVPACLAQACIRSLRLSSRISGWVKRSGPYKIFAR